MLFDLRGTIRPQDLEKVLAPFVAMLVDEGVETMNSISLNFLAWGSEDRLQIVDRAGFVTSLAIDAAEIAARSETSKLSLPEGVTFRVRPDDMEFSPFALAARRDD